MTTALELITGAGRLIGIVRKSEPLTADEAMDGLAALNDMLASWSNDQLIIYSRTREYFTLTGGTSSYTIGSGQTFNATKPTHIVSAFIREGTTDYPLTIFTEEEFDLIGEKTTQSNLPRALVYNNGHPYGTITLWNVPDSANQLHLLSEKPLTEISSLSTTIDLPVGTKRAIRYNLAIEMAPEYEAEIPPAVVKIAGTSLGAIKRQVNRKRPIKYLGGIIREDDIYTGYWS